MMQFDRMTLGKKARELGFVRDTFEKVCRLADVLDFIQKDELLSNALALKGGTAINLTIFNLPRLSVDIDMDFSENVPREEMLAIRKQITERISKYMTAAGYHLSQKSKTYHALDSFVYEYQNTGGMKDNLKIEINYMLRCHVLAPVRRTVNLPWLEQELTVLSVDPLEIYGSKIVALLNRAAPRDLYDIHTMMKYGLFDEPQEPMLKKCVMFYSAIGSDNVPDRFHFEQIAGGIFRRVGDLVIAGGLLLFPAHHAEKVHLAFQVLAGVGLDAFQDTLGAVDHSAAAGLQRIEGACLDEVFQRAAIQFVAVQPLAEIVQAAVGAVFALLYHRIDQVAAHAFDGVETEADAVAIDGESAAGDVDVRRQERNAHVLALGDIL